MASIRTNQGYFKFKGVSSMDMKVFMLELPKRPTPAARGKSEDVPALDGKLWIPENTFERITVSCKMECGDGADIDAINAWLIGEGDLIFMDEPDKCYHARITKGVERSHSDKRRINRNWTQQWDCEPFRYQANPQTPLWYSASGSIIKNIGTIESKPLLQITCAGNGTLMIGGVNTIQINDYTGTITVDCDAKVAYSGTGTASDPYVLRNAHVGGEWPVIPVGNQAIVFTDTITRVVVTPRWRWI